MESLALRYVDDVCLFHSSYLCTPRELELISIFGICRIFQDIFCFQSCRYFFRCQTLKVFEIYSLVQNDWPYKNVNHQEFGLLVNTVVVPAGHEVKPNSCISLKVIVSTCTTNGRKLFLFVVLVWCQKRISASQLDRKVVFSGFPVPCALWEWSGNLSSGFSMFNPLVFGSCWG